MKLFALLLTLFSLNTYAFDVNFCQKYEKRPAFIQAVNVVAQNMNYTLNELCAHPRVMDIYVTTRTFYNERNEEVPHTWVTIHYNEYSCQYFVRDADFVVTKKNCYNTW